MAGNINGERRGTIRQPSLLAGLLVDEQGERLSPSHAVSRGRRYRYYVSRHLIVEGRKPNRGWRFPAADLENLVQSRIRSWLSDPAAVIEAVEGDLEDAQVALITSAGKLSRRWPDLPAQETKAHLNALISRIVIRTASVVIEIDPEHVVETIMVGLSPARPRKERREGRNPIDLEIPAALRRAGTGIRFVVQGEARATNPDPSLTRLLVRAFAIRDRLDQDPNLSMQKIAQAEDVVPSYVTRLLRLIYLAPDIVTAIVDGRQPIGLTRLPLEWKAQRELLGFTPAG